MKIITSSLIVGLILVLGFTPLQSNFGGVKASKQRSSLTVITLKKPDTKLIAELAKLKQNVNSFQHLVSEIKKDSNKVITDSVKVDVELKLDSTKKKNWLKRIIDKIKNE